MPKKPPPLRVVWPPPPRAWDDCHVPETPCLITIDRTQQVPGLVSVQHLGGDMYGFHRDGFRWVIGQVEPDRFPPTREIRAYPTGDHVNHTVRADTLAAILGVLGATVTWPDHPPTWWGEAPVSRRKKPKPPS